MRWLYLPILFILSFVATQSGYGQDFFYREENTSTGMPTDCVYDLAKDDHGFMYLGTDQGLYVFNGINFRQVSSSESINNGITSIVFTDNNTLWCRNFADQIFYMDKDSLRALYIPETRLNADFIVDIKAWRNFIYVAGFKAIYVYDDSLNRWVAQIPLLDNESIGIVNDYVVVSDVHGKVTLISENKPIHSIKIPTGKYRLAGEHEIVLLENNKVSGTLFTIGTDLQPRNSRIEKPPFREGIYVNSLHFIKDLLAASTNQGTYILYEGKWKLFSTGQNHTDIIEDFQGGVWISTLDKGLIYLPSFDVYTLVPNPPGHYFREIIRSPAGFFVSMNNGLVYEISSTGKVLKTFDSQTGRDIQFIRFNEQKQLLYTSVGHFQYAEPEKFTAFYYGKDLTWDRHGNIYFGIHSLSGMIQSHTAYNPFRFPLVDSLRVDGQTFFPIRKKRSLAVQYLDESLYIAYVDKLIQYTPDGFTEIVDLSGNSIQALDFAVDSLGNLWASTVQNGIFCIKGNQVVRHFTSTNGLSHNQCRGITSFGNEILVTTISGVDLIRPGKAQVEPVSPAHTLGDLFISDVIKHPDFLLLVTKNGIIRINHSISGAYIAPQIRLTGITVDQKKFYENMPILSFEENTVEVSWEYLAFREGKSLPLYYRLKGAGEEWYTLSPTVNSVLYNKLSHGEYTFEICVNKDMSTLQAISFTVEKPFWITWWFFVLVFLGLLFLIWLTMRLTQIRVKKKQQFRELLILSQLKAIRSQMNPHFLYNVLNSLQGLIYSKKVNEAGTYVSMFSDHLRNILNMSEKQQVSIKEEIEGLRIYLELEKLRFGADFKYEIQKDSDIGDHLSIPSMILQPYVENAVKHGLLNKRGEKLVSIRFKKHDDDYISVSITDNGIGRDESQRINQMRKDKPQSFATKAIDNRIDLLNKQLKKQISLTIHDLKENGRPTGTAVMFNIPIDHKYDENTAG